MLQKLNHFKILEQIGKGGSGTVFKALDIRLKRNVAIKVIQPNPDFQEEDLHRFLVEARSASSINHPNICTVFDIGQQKDVHYIVMEYLEGETLRQTLEKRDSFLDSEVIDIGIKVCNALSAAHEKGIIHRDIKPDNIMLCRDGSIKVMDFGLAKLKDSELKQVPIDFSKFDSSQKEITYHTSMSTMLGTLLYMSPEQIEKKQVDERSDIFSLGIVLYEMLTSEQPFKGNTTTSIMQSILKEQPESIENFNSKIDTDLSNLIFKSLEKNKKNRFQNVGEIQFLLQNIKNQSEHTGKLKNINETKNFKSQRQTRFKALQRVGFILLFLLTIFIVSWLFKDQKSFIEIISSIGFMYNTENKYTIAVAPLWSVDERAAQAGKNFQKLIIEKLKEKFENEKLIKIMSDEKIQIIQSHNEAYVHGNKLDVSALIWGSVTNEIGVFNFHPSITFFNYPRRNTNRSNDQLLVAISNFNKIDLDNIDKTNVDIIAKFISARYYFSIKDIDKTLSVCNKIDSLQPDNMILKAMTFHRQKKYLKAVRVYKKILSLYSNQYKSDVVYGNLISSIRKLGMYDLAYEYSLKAVESDTTAPGNYNTAAELCMKMGKYEEATSYFLGAIQLDYQNFSFHSDLGKCYFLKEEYDDAIKSFDRAINLNERSYGCFYDLGTVYHYMKKFENAILNYKKAIRADPTQAWVHYNLGLVYLNQEKYKLAIREFKKAIKIRPEVKDFYNGLSISFMAKGELNESIIYSKKAVEANSDNPSTRLICFLNLFRNNRQAEAIYKLSNFRGVMDKNNWFSSIIDFYLGKVDEKKVLEASNHKFPHTNKGQKCEAYYYIGMAHLLGLRQEITTHQDTLLAKQFFQKSLDTGIMDFLEYEMANIEIKKL